MVGGVVASLQTSKYRQSQESSHGFEQRGGDLDVACEFVAGGRGSRIHATFGNGNDDRLMALLVELGAAGISVLKCLHYAGHTIHIAVVFRMPGSNLPSVPMRRIRAVVQADVTIPPPSLAPYS